MVFEVVLQGGFAGDKQDDEKMIRTMLGLSMQQEANDLVINEERK